MIPASVAHGVQETNKVNHQQGDVNYDEKMISVVVQQKQQYQHQQVIADDQPFVVGGGGPLSSMASLTDSMPLYPTKDDSLPRSSVSITGSVGDEVSNECQKTTRDDDSKPTSRTTATETSSLYRTTNNGASNPNLAEVHPKSTGSSQQNIISTTTTEQRTQPTIILSSSSSQVSQGEECSPSSSSSSSSSPDQPSETNGASTDKSSSPSDETGSRNLKENKNDEHNINPPTSNVNGLRSSLKHNKDESSSVSSASSKQQPQQQTDRRQRGRRRRHVSFSTVQIRRYPMVLGDNPAVLSGPPVTLGWEYEVLPEMSLIDFETFRLRSRRLHSSHLVLSHYKRIEIIQRCGYTEREIQVTEREISKIRRQRNMSVALSPFSTVQNIAESAGRKVRRGFGAGRRRKKT